MGAQIINNDIDVMIYLRDPVSHQDYESEVNSILHLCDMHNIPLATNLATAEVLLLALDRGDLDWRNVVTKVFHQLFLVIMGNQTDIHSRPPSNNDFVSLFLMFSIRPTATMFVHMELPP